MDLCLPNLSQVRLPMFDDTGLIGSLGNMLSVLLKPLVRLLVKHSFPYTAFEEVAKRVYVDVALEVAGGSGRKPSVSRAAVITGLTRKEVTALLATPWNGPEADAALHNRATKVVSAWSRDKALRGVDGNPRPISPVEFAELVRRASGDMPMRAVLDELVRVGSIAERADGTLELVVRAFVPADMQRKVHILGTDAGELIETIIFNIEREAGTDSRFQRKVMHTGIPIKVFPEFQEISSKNAMALLEELDAWLSARDVTDVNEEDRPLSGQVGLGIYYYQRTSELGEVRK